MTSGGIRARTTTSCSTARRRRGAISRHRPGYAGQDNDWIGLYINPVTDAFWEEMKANPNIPYKPFGAGS